jgi:hypothetical protein
VSAGRATELQALLSQSAREAYRWFSLMEPWKAPGPRRVYPAVTLRTLHLAGLVHFQSGVHLLRPPLLAYAVEQHVRTLIELLAHAAWIQNEGGLNAPLTARGRAICVELGMADAIAQEFRLLESEGGIKFPTQTLENSRYLAEHFRQLHVKDKCRCGGKGHGFWTVKPTLIKLANADKARLTTANLLYGLWRTYSRSTHHPRLENLAANVPGGAALQRSSIADRSLWLQNLLLPQSYLALAAASPFPAAKRDIGLSAEFLRDSARRLGVTVSDES